jgi:hypothetical protein
MGTSRLGIVKVKGLALAIAVLVAGFITAGGSDAASADTARYDVTLSWSDPDTDADPASSTADDAVTFGSSTFSTFFAVVFARHRIARVAASARRTSGTPPRAPPGVVAIAGAFPACVELPSPPCITSSPPATSFEQHRGVVLRKG